VDQRSTDLSYGRYYYFLVGTVRLTSVYYLPGPGKLRITLEFYVSRSKTEVEGILYLDIYV